MSRAALASSHPAAPTDCSKRLSRLIGFVQARRAAKYGTLAREFVSGWAPQELGSDAADELMRDIREGLLNGPL